MTMTRFVRNRIILTLAIAWLAYWPTTLLAPRNMLFEFVNGMTAAASVGLFVAFAPGAWHALRARPYRLNGAHLLVLGIAIMSFATTALFLWGWTYIILAQPLWMVGHLFRGWLVYLFFLGALLPLLATDINHEVMPTRGWLHVGMIVAAGCAAVVVIILAGV